MTFASSLPRLSDLEMPAFDLSNEAPETLLLKLRAQNGALASLRDALAFEEKLFVKDVRAAA